MIYTCGLQDTAEPTPSFWQFKQYAKNGMHCYFGAEKWYAASKISKEFKDYISIENARPCKNDTLYKAH